ncbi:MAG: hypothetical protein ACRDF4_01225 [Rhabdochlamydiaceae bacterium]
MSASEKTEKRISIRPSLPIQRYLDQIVDMGIHGSSVTEVAERLISNEVERLVRSGLLKPHGHGKE